MPLTAGTRFGTYEIVAPIGSGGMGDVYRARDHKLNRDVALKMTSGEFARDQDRLARFQREATVLASLNHPNIAVLHGFEEHAGVSALVMELVEGPTLADLIAGERSGPGGAPPPFHEAVRLAGQIADALGAAHDQGIIHRDLKPANIKVRPDGTVKVLDFGLAKALDSGSAVHSQAATRPGECTELGMVLGTPAYMSPEQAKGQPVDARTDVWAFGAVLFELLSGRQAFHGDSAPETLAAVITSSPHWDALPPTLPGHARRLLERCLAKDPRERIRDIRDARLILDGAFEAGIPAQRPDVTAPTPWWKRATPWLGGALAGGLIAAAVISGGRAEPPTERSLRLTITLPATDQFPVETGFPISVAISPDGHQVVYAARRNGVTRLYSRRLDEFDVTAIAGTDGALAPFFAPDGAWIGFYADGALKKLSLSGGTPVTITAAPNVTGATWIRNGEIVFSRWRSGLSIVSAAGGTPRPFTALQDDEQAHYFPHALPDGRAVLFATRNRIEAVDVTTGERQFVIDGSNPFYAGSGHLVFARGGTIHTAAFDLAKRVVTAAPSVIVNGVDAQTDAGLDKSNFAISMTGTLAYTPATPRTVGLVWVDRLGRLQAFNDERKVFSHPRLSPDGSRMAVGVRRDAAQEEIWVYDVGRGVGSRFAEPPATRPVWTPDGTRLTFQRNGRLYTAPADGTGQPALTIEQAGYLLFPLSWSRTGDALAYSAVDSVTSRNVWLFSPPDPPRPFLNSDADERAAGFAPDGRWMTYARREAGAPEQVFIQPVTGPGERTPISVGGGVEPVWSPMGREIFYRSPDGRRLFAVDVHTSGSLTVGAPRLLFEGDLIDVGGGFFADYDVSRDGTRFLMTRRADGSATPVVHVVVDAIR